MFSREAGPVVCPLLGVFFRVYLLSNWIDWFDWLIIYFHLNRWVQSNNKRIKIYNCTGIGCSARYEQ
jgi:hypothetical protein